MRAYMTLYTVLTGIYRLIAPYCPFTSEFFWNELTKADHNGRPASVHMTEYPGFDESLIMPEVEESMTLAQKIVSTGRAARSRKNLKVRQPLAGILVNIPGRNQFDKVKGDFDIIKGELNIKEMEELKDVSGVVSYTAKLNFANAGSKLGKLAKATAAKVAGLTQDEIKQFLGSGGIKVEIEGETVSLESDYLIIDKIEKDGFAVESVDGITVALKTEIDDNLRDEGFAREVVNKVQNMRKSSGFEVTDRINILIDTADPLASALRKYGETICDETLADNLDLVDSIPADKEAKNWNINGVKADIAVFKL